MKVKKARNIIDVKVVDPKSGKVGIFKGMCNGRVFIGTNKTSNCIVFPYDISKEEFGEWELATSKDKVNIHTL